MARTTGYDGVFESEMHAELEQLLQGIDRAYGYRESTGTRPRVRVPVGGLLAPPESTPPGSTLYVNIPLGIERPARPMTGIFCPANYRPQSRVDLIVYLHGHKEPCGLPVGASINRYWKQPAFKLREALNASRKNVILVAPTLGPKSEAAPLTTGTAFDAYLNRVMTVLWKFGPYKTASSAPVVGNIIIACHSGGGKPMLQLALGRNRHTARIRECWGFDCLYGGTPLAKLWSRWAIANPGSKLYVHFLGTKATPHNTVGASQALQGTLPNVKVEHAKTLDHCHVPLRHWQERLGAASFLKNTWVR